MEVEKTHQSQPFARIGNNGRAKNNPDEEKSDNNEMIKMNTVGVSTTANCLNGWHQSRIIRVSRASGGKDRHSKVWTSKGLRDRRVRLSVQTAIQFYDLQDRLGYDQPSKAVEWLIKAAADAIAELPSLNAPSLFPNTPKQQLSDEKKHRTETQSQQQQCSSTSDTSLSLSRLEKRVKARERARDRTAKDKDVEINTNNRNGNNHFNDGETFTELLTTGIESNSHNSQMGYAFGRNQPQFHMGNSTLFSIDVSGEPHHQQMQQFSFIPDYIPVSAATMSSSGGGGDVYNLNFSALSSSSAGGFNGGTLQSNNTISSSFLSPNHLQRFSHPLESSVPFFFGAAAPTLSMENHQFPGGLQLYGDGSRHSDHKGKPKH